MTEAENSHENNRLFPTEAEKYLPCGVNWIVSWDRLTINGYAVTWTISSKD